MHLIVLLLLLLTACGGGGPVSLTLSGPITVTCNQCTVPSAASAPNPPTPSGPPSAVPLAVPQTDGLPYITVCAGCLKWSSGGIHYALVFRDLSGLAQIAMVVSCSAQDCTPGPNVWEVATPIIDDAVDLDLEALRTQVLGAGTDINLLGNPVLTDYAKATIFPKLAAWFDVNRGNLLNNFTATEASTLPVPETGDAFARLTAITNEHIILDQAVATWH